MGSGLAMAKRLVAVNLLACEIGKMPDAGFSLRAFPLSLPLPRAVFLRFAGQAKTTRAAHTQFKLT